MTQSSTRLTAELPPCDYRPTVYDGPSRQQVLIDRQRFCNPAIFTLYSEPLMIVEGHLQYLFDETDAAIWTCWPAFPRFRAGTATRKSHNE